MATENSTTTEKVYVEKSGGGFGGVLLGVAALALVAIIAFFALSYNRNETVKTNAISNAASSVAGAADSVGDAVTPNR